MRISDWSSDVCPSDLNRQLAAIAQHRPADDAEHDHRRAGTAKDGAAITLGPERCIKEDRLEHLAIDDDEGEQEQEPGRARRKRLVQLVANISLPRSEEHTSELQSLMRISYAVFCLKKKTRTQ